MSSNYRAHASQELHDWSRTVEDWRDQVLAEFNGTEWSLQVTHEHSREQTLLLLAPDNEVCKCTGMPL